MGGVREEGWRSEGGGEGEWERGGRRGGGVREERNERRREEGWRSEGGGEEREEEGGGVEE